MVSTGSETYPTMVFGLREIKLPSSASTELDNLTVYAVDVKLYVWTKFKPVSTVLKY